MVGARRSKINTNCYLYSSSHANLILLFVLGRAKQRGILPETYKASIGISGDADRGRKYTSYYIKNGGFAIADLSAAKSTQWSH